MDKNRDGFWDKDEFIGNLTIGRGKPLLARCVRVDQRHRFSRREFNRGIPEVPSPILHDRLIYMVSNGGVLTCVDADLGKMVYRRRLGGYGQYLASQDRWNRLLLASEEGLLSLVRTGRELALTGSSCTPGKNQSDSRFGKEDLYLRGESTLGLRELIPRPLRNFRALNRCRKSRPGLDLGRSPMLPIFLECLSQFRFSLARLLTRCGPWRDRKVPRVEGWLVDRWP